MTALPLSVSFGRSITARLRRGIATLLRGCVVAYRAAPREATILVACGVIGGVTPVLLAWLQKELVDHLEYLIRRGSMTWSTYLTWITGLLITLALVVDVTSSIQVFSMTAVRDKIEGSIKTRLLAKVTQSKSLDLFEDPVQLNALNLAQQAIPRYQQLDNCFLTLVLGVFSTVPAILLSATIAWWLPLLLCLTVVPAAIVQFRLEGQIWNAEATLAESRRRQLIIEEMITRPTFAKDLRLYSLGSLLVGRWQEVFQRNFDHLNDLRLRGLRKTILLSIVGTIGIVIPLITVTRGVVTGTQTVGALVLLLGIGFSLRQGLHNLLWVSSQLSGITMAVDHFESFVNSAVPTTVVPTTDIIPPRLTHALTLKDVSFTYPGSSAPSLRDVSLEIAPETTIAIVGENGAGKSTLAKVIGRLYAPTTGSILWDGMDIATFDIDGWRSRIGFMAQDVAELPVTIEDYLRFSRLDAPSSEEELIAVLRHNDLTPLLSRGALGLATPLTKELPQGTQLSGGEWQRLSLARVSLRAPSAHLLILDEPTSAVDPAAEHDQIERLLEISAGRTAIIITHRLALCTAVDRVIVLHEGSIIEDGSHAELMAQGGHYASMFHAQANRYIQDS